MRRDSDSSNNNNNNNNNNNKINNNNMSTCRIERKRAHDREAQRVSRAKTKAYIQHLEKTVTDLTRSSGNCHSNYLAERTAKQSQEIETLQGLVGKIRSLVGEISKPEENTSLALTTQAKPEREGSACGSTVDEVTVLEPFSAGVTWDSPPGEDPWSENGGTLQRHDMRHATKTGSTTRNLLIMGTNMLCEETDDNSYALRLNDVISRLEQTPDNLSSYEEDQDILVRAITSGWNAAENVHHFDIVWRFLRAFDEGLWYRAGPVERMASCWNMRSNLLYNIMPKNQDRRVRAPFMTPTTLQRCVPSHPRLVDYYAWPQVRDGLITQGLSCCTGRTTIAYVQNFRFDWPYEFRDLYKYDTRKGTFSVTEQFIKSIRDIASFGMLENDKIPQFVYPTPESQAPGTNATESDSDSSTTEEVHNVADVLRIHGHDKALQGHAMETVAAFPVDVSDLAGNYAYDPFPRADLVGLAQWPSFA